MSARAGPDPNSEKSVAWPDLRGSLERAGALAAELAAAAEERARLARRLEAALEVRRESVRQGAALDELSRRLERRRARADELAVARRRAAEGVERRKEQMQAQIERVLPLSRALAAAHRQVQEAKELKSAEKARLGDLQRLLRTRQQSMVAQVAALYPVRVFRDLPAAENHHSRTNGECRTPSEENGALPQEMNGNGRHLLSIIKSPHVGPLTFFGWQIGKPKTKQPSYSHKELQRSAAVLGYAAHAVLLIASYLDIPLRYPLRFGGSRSYVGDRLPSAEASSMGSTEHRRVGSADSKLTDYPLFLEYQDDSTKASYAIHLLQKVCAGR
ncbi:spindle assembly checkpoint component MAD1-like isoform X4 [Triticum urartu]|uniref:spindle assembly checkpoint component MAD1 isoform X4 n=1 Tax=Triticum aestivum TaxID=4565 RepID=UPI001D031FC1|nr:spindle assembly checkpoint component MAD1-like isoform X4 [Triticum aestivum]XP_048543236.1 spindle assembly checkpoint component MAD1-like isoform X4 [Triticum urartu]